jgi:hypothetical protein
MRRFLGSRTFSIVAGVLACQLVLWLAVGRHRMYRAAPSMAEAIMRVYQRHAIRYGAAVNGKRAHLNLIVCDDLASSLGPRGVAALGQRLQPYDVTLFTRKTAPSHFLSKKARCEDCQIFCVEPRLDTPLIGVAESSTWWGLLGANGFTNVNIFILGWWVRVATWPSWVA